MDVYRRAANWREALRCIDVWPEGTDDSEQLAQIKHFTAWCLSEQFDGNLLFRVKELVDRRARAGYRFACLLYEIIGWPVGVKPERVKLNPIVASLLQDADLMRETQEAFEAAERGEGKPWKQICVEQGMEAERVAEKEIGR